MVSKLGPWVPHKLTEKQRIARVNIAASLLTRQHAEDFLDRVITGDEKWILYEDNKRKRQWVDADESGKPTPKNDLHPKKVLLSIWWDKGGVVYWELLPTNQTIISEVYSAQLNRLNEELQKKRPALVNRKGVILQHDNARPHVAKTTLEKLKELKWEALIHPPYSPDLAPTDFHLFLSLSNFLRGKKFGSLEPLKMALGSFFDSKSVGFYSSGIYKLTARWEDVIKKDGEYIED